MKARRFIVGGLSLAALIIAAAAITNSLPGARVVQNAGQNAASQSATPHAPSASTPTPGAALGPAAPGSAPPAAPGQKQSAEVTAPGAAKPGELPSSKPVLDPVSSPLPPTASASGTIAKGFPSAVIPEAPHSTIGTSSIASEGSHLQAALKAKTTLSAIEVLAFYRSALAPYGMFDTPAPALGGSSALTFSRGTDSVTITVTTVAGGSSYVIFGAFTAKS